ncbi:MAG: Adaptive-response sensory-kinase SasA [Pseudomonadales bacterium]|nr:Adaptive-response sensory-kinase SasA [Pseudomonadales bacterium]
MTLDYGTLVVVGIGYLWLLFAIAWATDRGFLPESIASHPLVYTLSLGIVAGAWPMFGSISVAAHFGYGYLGYFVGTGVMFLFAPLLLIPLWRICRRFQLTSLADLLAFRYRGAHVGAIATFGLLATALPLLIAQIKLVSGLGARLTGELATDPASGRLGLVVAGGIAVFAILFGARPISEKERHNGLIVAMAFESLVKLGCFLALGAFVLFEVHGGSAGLGSWLEAQPGLVESLHASMRSSSSHMMTLTFFAAVVGLPDLFHMALYENPSPRAVVRASWGFPVFLLLLSLPVLPLLWAELRLGTTGAVEFIAIGAQSANPTIGLLTFIACVSAATSMTVVTTLALASATLNNLVLPFYRPGELYRPGERSDPYRGLTLTRSVLIALLVLAAYLISARLPDEGIVETLGFSAFVAAAQFFPGLLALLYWPRANRIGLLGGLAGGYAVWLLALVDPAPGSVLGIVHALLPFAIEDNPWAGAAVNSLALNATLLFVLSQLSTQSTEEQEAATSCSLDNLSGAARHRLLARSPGDFVSGLGSALGEERARREVERALRDLGYAPTETRPYAMRRLRERIEANLSRLVGAEVAMELINRGAPFVHEDTASTGDLTLVESRLEDYQRHLTGFTAELDALRRFYRDTLYALPLGVCGTNARGEIVMWNAALQRITGIDARTVLGSTLDGLPEPWGSLLTGFLRSSESHLHQHRVGARGNRLCLSLHKTADAAPGSRTGDARFILLEDVTETQRLQDELLHTERLASIGRLAAGVAHEIGNPVTGIDSLAQNLLADSADDDCHESARLILQQTQRISNIVHALVGFAHTGANRASEPVPVAVAQCAAEAIYLLGLDRSARPVRFLNLCPPSVCVRGDGQRLLQVFINLLSNARAASADHGEIAIAAQDQGETVLITVTDDGCGIPPAKLEQVFEPFYTTKSPGEGTGLGLSLVYSIVRDMGGSVSLHSPVDAATGRGTRALIRLPSAGSAGPALEIGGH